MKDGGILLHAKHAYMPNSLGYCGPDQNGRILQHLEEGRGGEDLAATLREFEAAYPFLKLIARNSGRQIFDYSVPEAYWIGNELLESVSPLDFYDFSRRELKGAGMKGLQLSFKKLDGLARPHHSFYVMGTYAGSGTGDGPDLGNEGERKIEELIDNCRISWGKVEEVAKSELKVEFRPMAIDRGRFRLGIPATKLVRYDPEVEPFGGVKRGDFVSMHWNYACDLLTPRQVLNIGKHTEADMTVANRLLSRKGKRR
jgi:Family of unknown function (DUF6390)